jgi:carboxyl-terminal processing protease
VIVDLSLNSGGYDFVARAIAGRFAATRALACTAGEVAVLCFRTQPHVRHLGEPTRGGLSTVLSKPLPNGWRLSLSNEIFADHRGEVWEGRGIPPEVRIPVFDPVAPMGHAEAVRAVLGIIDSVNR